jgi:MEKHLA domain
MSYRQPSAANQYLEQHVKLLLSSFSHWTGQKLMDEAPSTIEQAKNLYFAPFVVLSHDRSPEPILNYANEIGLTLFELTWSELIVLPSRLTAEPVHQSERARLLDTVSSRGYIDDYQGIRISKSGRRFIIDKATVWNVIDQTGSLRGQAATFSTWKFLD